MMIQNLTHIICLNRKASPVQRSDDTAKYYDLLTNKQTNLPHIFVCVSVYPFLRLYGYDDARDRVKKL